MQRLIKDDNLLESKNGDINIININDAITIKNKNKNSRKKKK